MISWQLYKKDKPLGKALYFSNFTSQAYLLHIIDVGAKDLDEYGSWVYKEEDMKRLKIVLLNWLDRHEVAEDKKIFIDTICEGKGELHLKKTITLFQETINLIDIALKNGADLCFSGD